MRRRLTRSVSNDLAGDTSWFSSRAVFFFFIQFFPFGSIARLGFRPDDLEFGRLPIAQQFDLAVLVLDERGTILDPIAAVVIGDAADLPNDGAVNVPAEHALDMVALGITNDRLFV